jgi:erythromycin esterase-like protein
MRRKFLALIFAFIACSAASPADAPSTLAAHAHRITGAATDYDPLLRAMGNAHLILLGEATHGTHEFYRERSRITQRLLRERGFTALALEADWADAARVNRYVCGEGSDRTAIEALGDFKRFPRWMWRNREFAELVEWLREFNKTRDDRLKQC